MTYEQAAVLITHKHELAGLFTKLYAESQLLDINFQRPEAFYPFRAEQCAKCNDWHIRRGPNVYLKAV